MVPCKFSKKKPLPPFSFIFECSQAKPEHFCNFWMVIALHFNKHLGYCISLSNYFIYLQVCFILLCIPKKPYKCFVVNKRAENSLEKDPLASSKMSIPLSICELPVVESRKLFNKKASPHNAFFFQKCWISLTGSKKAFHITKWFMRSAFLCQPFLTCSAMRNVILQQLMNQH